MPKDPQLIADETVTIRLPKGTAAKLRAATGQPFSRLMRFVAISLLDQYQGQQRLTDTAHEVGDKVRSLDIGDIRNG